MKKWLFVLLSLILSGTISGQDKILTSRVYLKEKQNKPAATIPKILLDAFSKGDIKAYYPKNTRIQVPYAQFLNHFGMPEKAEKVLANDAPYWFCDRSVIVPVDEDVMDCMQYSFELGERVYKNRITYEQERKIMYVKLIYAAECAADGVEKEGPIFMLKDVNALKGRQYHVKNYENPAVTYKVADFLKLRLFSAN